ncbi:unnamed protein product [Ixodes persulcatus]
MTSPHSPISRRSRPRGTPYQTSWLDPFPKTWTRSATKNEDKRGPICSQNDQNQPTASTPMPSTYTTLKKVRRPQPALRIQNENTARPHHPLAWKCKPSRRPFKKTPSYKASQSALRARAP